MEDSKDESQFFKFYGQNSIKWFQDQVEEGFLNTLIIIITILP